jgi:hypothetical protein
MAVHVITITQARPGKFDVRLDGDGLLFVKSTALGPWFFITCPDAVQ